MDTEYYLNVGTTFNGKKLSFFTTGFPLEGYTTGDIVPAKWNSASDSRTIAENTEERNNHLGMLLNKRD